MGSVSCHHHRVATYICICCYVVVLMIQLDVGGGVGEKVKGLRFCVSVMF